MLREDTYKEVRTFRYGENVARVHIPDLTDEERERRMREIARLAGELLAARSEKLTQLS